jgi:hypothetical protein
MEKKNDRITISIPIKIGYLLISPVSTAVKKTNMVQKNIPFLLWFMGPGLSAILVLKAPREIVKPIDKRSS